MRDRRVRMLFVVLILAFPMAIDAVSGSIQRHPDAKPTAASARASFHPGAAWPVHGTQCVLLAGLTLAGRARKQLLAGIENVD